MTAMEGNRIRRAVKERRPLIHCITNPISINSCANAVLALGARPIMAEHPQEVREITETAQALLLNLGNITDVRIQSMQISAEAAIEKEIPFVLDVVGIACSRLRREFAHRLIEKSRPTVIKGNYSEIRALYHSSYKSAGVDAEESLDKIAMANITGELAQKYHTIILASGAEDIVTDGKRLVFVKNGTPQLASVTGTGCMLGALCSCYLSVCRDMAAVVTACAVLGICGELAGTAEGNGSFGINLMDRLSILSDADLENRLKIEEMEETEIENI